MAASYTCLVCRATTDVWVMRCAKCGRHNSFSVGGSEGQIVKSTSEDLEPVIHIPTGVKLLDDVLLGGVVMPSALLFGGIAGAGKSTLILQAAGGLAATGLRVVYICAEEETNIVAKRARRVSAVHDNLDLVRTTDPSVAVHIAATYDVAIYDSIQKLGANPKDLNVPKTRFLVSQLNKQNEVAGERSIEHDPDVLLYCDYFPQDNTRFLVCTKNRNGEILKAPYTLGEFGAVGMPCKKCDQCVVPCKCPPKEKKKKKGDEDRP